MLKRNSPFAVKPRASLAAMKWFWDFYRNCNGVKMLESATANHALLQSSLALYEQLIENESIDCDWQKRGLLFVFEHEKEFTEYAKTHQLIEKHYGVSATPYATDELVKLEPAIKPVVAGAWHYENDCHLRPDKLMAAMKTKLQQRGVTIIEQTSVTKIVKENGHARAVTIKNSNGETSRIDADQIIVATGAWTPFLNSHLGCKIPIQPGKGYSLTMRAPAAMPKIPIIFEDTHVAITPMAEKYRIGSTMEFVGYDTSIHPRRLKLLIESAKRYLHDPVAEPIEEEWFGWRPMTPDSKPIIDRSPAFANVWICAGHSMLGLSMATGSGKLMREMILSESPHIDVAPFAVSRF
jgi:D-amino-acid dehydrogenase